MAYPTVDDFRALGIEEADYDDDAVNAALAIAIQFIERATGQFFVAREADVRLDGNDSDTLFLPVPVISLTELYVNGSTTATDASCWVAYTGRQSPADDRKNPRVTLASSDSGDIFTGPISYGPGWKFRRGRQNQRLVGTFGYTEADGSTPALVNRAIMKVALEKLGPLVTTDDSPDAPEVPAILREIASETTDGHSITYAQADRSGRRVGLSGISADPEVEDVIKLYKSPIKLGAPADWSNWAWR